jgi:hypothetical protein
VIELADGLWRWTARHPDWHPRSEFGAEVGCYVAHEGGGTVLIDPLLPDPVLAELDAIVTGEVVVAITIPYHVRDSAAAAARWGGVVSGHPDVRRRLPEGTPFDPDAGLRWHPLKRGKERPLELPGLRALAFGDRIVGVEGGLRYWSMNEVTESRRAFFRRQTAPQLRRLLDVEFDRALVTHGEPVLRDGHRALADALAGEPWYHAPS